MRQSGLETPCLGYIHEYAQDQIFVFGAGLGHQPHETHRLFLEAEFDFGLAANQPKMLESRLDAEAVFTCPFELGAGTTAAGKKTESILARAGSTAGLPIPALSSALSWFDGYRSASLPANLLQAQRDYFGAHTYERTDRPRGEFFHTDWTGHGGGTTSRTYNA